MTIADTLAALVAELVENDIPDLCRLAGEPLPPAVAAMLDRPALVATIAPIEEADSGNDDRVFDEDAQERLYDWQLVQVVRRYHEAHPEAAGGGEIDPRAPGPAHSRAGGGNRARSRPRFLARRP